MSHSGRRASRPAADSGPNRAGRDTAAAGCKFRKPARIASRERRDPQAFDRLAAAGQRVDEIEDQITPPASAALTTVVTSARSRSCVMTLN